ncbi:MAG: phosphoglycerate kinase [Chlamydiota bacterium]|nr:phosphoglycerate kinase [Chlamydiota bacterium]
MIPLPSIEDWEGKKTLVRLDLNLPTDREGRVTDRSRLDLPLPTLQALRAGGSPLILMSHRGSPGGHPEGDLSLAPFLPLLEEAIGCRVHFTGASIGPEVRKSVDRLKGGEILLLENMRFHPGEEDPNSFPEFIEEIASYGEGYVNEAFSVSHRPHGSIVSLPHYFPRDRAAGLAFLEERERLDLLLLHPETPFVACFGGAKVESKVGAIRGVLPRLSALMIGGGMAFPFLAAQGRDIGDFPLTPSQLLEAREIIALCHDQGVDLHLPNDMVAEGPDGSPALLSMEEGIPEGWQGKDIGPSTLDRWEGALRKAGTLFWNGPMGVFEEERFSWGTQSLAERLASAAGITVVGGGDTLAAIHRLGRSSAFDYLSTAGGALLSYLSSGGELIGEQALSSKLNP